MAGPNKQFDPNHTLDKALQLFWKKGYESTSMQELVDVMGVNRASLYQTYGNKHDLYTASLNRYIEGTLDTFKQTLEKSGPALENLRNLFQNLVLHSLQGGMQGCFINNSAVELGPHDLELAEQIRNVWIQFEDFFSIMIQRAVDNLELKADTDVRKIAQLLNTNLQGLIIQTKTNIKKKKLFDSIELIFDLIHE